MIDQILELIFHVDKGLTALFQNHGVWAYAAIWFFVFVETGVVVFPFLPGDSALFAAGALAGAEIADPWVLGVVFFTAAVCGDNCNFWVGRLIGRKLMQKNYNRMLSRKNLEKTQAFFVRWGVLTLILGRWVPIIRTFVPFVAGLGSMRYPMFLLCSIVGTFLWVVLAGGAGLLFGNIPIVKNNFSLAMLAVVGLSLTPIVIGVVRNRVLARGSAAAERPAPDAAPAPAPADAHPPALVGGERPTRG